ncbi:MAG: PIN domain-containing protein [Actinomycetia bacterium]|nr:PIN domain-containing protein [Actinomycetes bacterium]
MRTVVLDTNVLLGDPGSLGAYPDAEVIIPDTVLSEIDKLKTQRVDPELRFKGREVSRRLFELSETGSLADGVDLPAGGRLRVVPLNSDVELPEGLATRNADDRILAVAYQVCSQGCEDLTLVTNDLNMLLKAQTLGIKVERRAETDAGFARKYIIRPFQRYRVPLTILAIAIAVFAGVFALGFYTTNLNETSATATGVPTEFRDLLSADQRTLLDGLVKLEADPNDPEALKNVANAFYNLRDQTGNVQYAQKAIEYYERYLKLRPDDQDVRTDLAAMYFYAGATDRAIQTATQVIEASPDHVQANFNLGIFYWRGRNDYQAAALQFKKVVELTQNGDSHTQLINDQARSNIATIIKEADAAGQPLDVKALGLDGLDGGTI